MSTGQQPHPDPDARTPFQKFQDLARRILTTPKAELMKGNGKTHQRRTPKKK